MPHIKVVGRNFCLFEVFSLVHVSRIKCCMNNSEKAVCNSSFTVEVSTTVNLDRWKGAVVRLLITTYADNKRLFGGKAKNKNAFEKTAEQFTKVSGHLVKRQRGACERMGLVTNGTHSSQTEIPKTNFPNFFKMENAHHLLGRYFHNELLYLSMTCGVFRYRQS